MLLGRFNKNVAALALGGCLAITVKTGRAESAFNRNFNGPDTVWQLANTGVPAQILSQQSAQGGARDNAGFERIVVAAPAGQSAQFVCQIPRMAVLDELQIRLWVNASRPDVQLAARVILPRSVNPQTRGAAAAILRGSMYNRPGRWQELRIADVPKLLADQVRVMRATPGATIDPHEAYVDAIVLLVAGNPSGTDVGTDDLQVDGVLLSATADGAQPIARQAAASRAASASLRQRPQTTGPQADVVPRDEHRSEAKTAAVRLEGTTLDVDGKPFLPRVIQWNGESLQFLLGLGFNVVQLPTSPSPEQSAEAARLGLWFLCSPEHPDALNRSGLGQPGDRVLAWHLQDDALAVDANYGMRWAELVRERDAVFGRPVVITPDSNWSTTNKAADILVARFPRMVMSSPAEFRTWLEVCPGKAQPGTPLWVCLATQSDDATRRQVAALTHGASPRGDVDGPLLESIVQIACTCGARGFVFQSGSPLSETDDATRRRAATLQVINRRLQLIEPWLAGGKVVERMPSTDGAQLGVLLHVDRARLLIPLKNENGLQANAQGQKTRSAEVTFTVPGIPETSELFYLAPAAMQLLPSQRVAGGTRFALPAAGDGFSLMTEDPQVIQILRQRVARDGAKTVQLQRDLAVQRASRLAYCGQKLTQLGFKTDVIVSQAASINQQLSQLDAMLASGQIEQSQQAAAVVKQNVALVEGEERRLLGAFAGFESNPLAASLDTLPDLAALAPAIASQGRGENLLAGGDFEDLAQMTQVGWQHVAGSTANVETSAQLSAEGPQHGSYCLELNAAAKSKNERQPVAGNLVWIISPPIAIEPNQIIEISGWVRIDQPFAGGEGLEIVDSLGGPGLSFVVGQTYGWKPFRMIRSSAEADQFRVTFALTSLGAAKVDAVMVRTIGSNGIRRLPPAATTSPAMSTAGRGGSILVAPATR